MASYYMRRILGQTVTRTSDAAGYVGYQACLECHTPWEQELMTTPHAQAGVQCEDCHGPAASHAANYYDPATKPLVDLPAVSAAFAIRARNIPLTRNGAPALTRPWWRI